jgi:hypothetical protein
MSIVTRGLDINNSRIILQGYYDYYVHVQVIEREVPPSHGAGGIPIGFPGTSKRHERDIVIKIRGEDDDEWKFLFLENVDDDLDFLPAKVISIVGDEEKAKKISIRIKEQVSNGDKDFKFSVRELD